MNNVARIEVTLRLWEYVGQVGTCQIRRSWQPTQFPLSQQPQPARSRAARRKLQLPNDVGELPGQFDLAHGRAVVLPAHAGVVEAEVLGVLVFEDLPDPVLGEMVAMGGTPAANVEKPCIVVFTLSW